MDKRIDKEIFKDVLFRYKKEIVEMSLIEFDEEEFSEMLREEGRKEGREEERKNTLREKERADAAERKLELLMAEIERLKERKD